MTPFARSPSRRGRAARLRLERLEDRTTPATFTVTTPADAGAGSLRQAILDANATPGADDIVFAAGLTGGTIGLSTGLPAVTESVTITGPAGPVPVVTVSGQDLAGVRPFDIAATAAGVTIANLTITRGNPNGVADRGGGLRNAGPGTVLNNVVVTLNKAGGEGGGIANTGGLTITNSVISTNTATDDGGGIAQVAAAATLAVTGCDVTGNTAGDLGGGIDFEGGTGTITDTTVAGNHTTSDNGGGLELTSSPTVTLTRVTIAGNTAAGAGGGVRVSSGTLSAVNCTIDGNTATANSGGGGFSISTGTVTITDCTITGNTDTTGATNATRSGGIGRSAGTVTLANSVVANNTTSDGAAPDVRGTFAAGSVNNFIRIGDAALVGITDGANGNRVGTAAAPIDPQLGPLGHNGGFTQTRLPLVGSPLIDAGSTAAVPAGTTLDQRLVARVIGGAVDIGATEFQTQVLVVSGTPDGRALVFAPLVTGQFNPTAATPAGPFAGLGVDVRAADGDVNGDGVLDTILITGPGTAVRFAVVSGADNTTLLVPPTAPFAGSETFTGGGFVAAADLDHDGRAEIVLSPDQGGGPRVAIFSLGTGGALATRANFFGIDDPNFRGGARPALGDANGDGTPDLAVAAGFLGGPRVAVFDGKTVFTTPTRLVGDFFAFPGTDAVTLRNGAFVAAGDVNGDGSADLIFGGGPGGAPRVFILSGALVSAGNIDGAYAAPVANFFVANNSSDRGGVRVAAVDADGDGKADVAAGSGEGDPANVRVYLGKNFSGASEPTTFQDLAVFGGAALTDGVFVG